MKTICECFSHKILRFFFNLNKQKIFLLQEMSYYYYFFPSASSQNYCKSCTITGYTRPLISRWAYEGPCRRIKSWVLITRLWNNTVAKFLKILCCKVLCHEIIYSNKKKEGLSSLTSILVMTFFWIWLLRHEKQKQK